jgi:AcrR family transcriptional regulator
VTGYIARVADKNARQRLPAQERRHQIVESARTVFLRQGFAGTRTREIAEEAGITEAFLYRFFPSKEALYEAAVVDPMRDLVAELLATANGIGASDVDGREVLRQVNQMLARFMSDSAPFLATLWLRELGRGRVFYENELRPLLAQPINTIISKITGWNAPADDHSLIFATIIGVHVALAMDAMLRRRVFDPRRTGEQLTLLFAQGVPEAVQKSVVDPSRES